MKSYLAIFRARMRLLLQYRAAAAAGVGTRIFWGLIRLMIFEGFYRSTLAPQPMSFRDVAAYVWLGQAMLAMTLWRPDPDVRAMIRTGSLAYELARPLDLYSLWFSRALAANTAPTLLEAGPVLLIGGLFGMHAPPSWAAGAGWILSTGAALLLSAAMASLMTISLLWTLSGEGVSRMVPALAYVFSGMLVPLVLCPGWLRALVEFLPFGGLIDTPFRVYLGLIPPPRLAGALAHQLLWTVSFVALGRWLVGRASRRMVVQGG